MLGGGSFFDLAAWRERRIPDTVPFLVMRSLVSYLPLNPFVDLSVGEAELWGTRSWLDVPQIHAGQAAQLRQAVDLVRANRRTQVRFVRGVGGSGKSHLFARLRRELGSGILYAYASNPPLQPDTLESFLLGKIVASLRHRARHEDGTEAPFSQLRLLAYALLKPVIEQEGLSLEQLHESWSSIPLEEQKTLLHDAMLLLEAEHPMVSRGVLRCLLNVLRDDKESLAAHWLAGTSYLTDADLKYLGEPEPMGQELHGPTIHLLGKLAAMADRPFVLVLDQLDLVTSSQQLDEFQRLLFALIDQSENWVVFIGLVGERFRFWEENLNQAMRGRLGTPVAGQPDLFTLPVIDVTPILAADKEVLIRRRLASPALQRRRAEDAQSSTLFPLREEDLGALISGGAVYARHLLAASSERFSESVQEDGKFNRVPLAEKVDALLQEACDQTRDEVFSLSAVELGERVRELVEVLSDPAPKLSPGGLREAVRSFDGADQVADFAGRKLRLVSSEATRRQFISVLQVLLLDAGSVLLLRSTAALVSGQVTTELMTQFKARHHFHTITTAEATMLAGLGCMLASLREGNYDSLLTEPPATKENVMAVLKQSGRLRSLGVWLSVQQALAGKPTPAFPPAPEIALPKLAEPVPQPLPAPTVAVSKAPPPPPSFPLPVPLPQPTKAKEAVVEMPPASLSKEARETVEVLLKTERWMDLRRLQRRLAELGCVCSLESLRYALRIAPLAESAMLHPLDPDDAAEGPQIVLWHESVH